MAFNGNESSAITLNQAASLTSNYRTSNPNSVKGHFFGVNKIEDILNQNGCVGIRRYYGEDNQGGKQLVMVGVKSDESDITDGVILDMSLPKPLWFGK